MSVNNTPPVIQHDGNGVTKSFNYPFKILNGADLVAQVGNAILVYGVDYVVTGVGDDVGGQVIFVVAPVIGVANVTLFRQITFDRSTDYQYQGPLPSLVVNQDFDRLTMMLQQVGQDIKRSFKLPFATFTNQEINQASALRANKVILFDGDGNLNIGTDNYVDQTAAVAASAAAALASKQAAAGYASASQDAATASAGSANAAANSAQQSAASADTSAQNVLLAAKWATYLGGPVSGGEYSAKYWAGKAAEAASGDAINIKFTPDGNVFSTNVQAAIQELDTKKANVADLSAAIPVGMRGEFFTNTAPDNWIKANGGAIPVASYAVLAVVLYCGDANNATAAWGYRCTSAATPTTTRSTTGAYIVLPDARGEYSRGWDDGRGIDAGRSLWAWQAGQVLSHTHTASQAAHSHTVNLVGGGSGGALGISYMVDLFQGTTPTSAAQPAITVTATGGTENLVRGLAALVCIKYK
ncbi:hypothetical protein [Herbaspirillum autotrophicum]|uniref:hypothetical protein n=1 Tax=Herbaspirillum autotrophicum TaxID=180195 RepID=UPI00067C2F61|nr:hypothetical protein [Herbaspirillum autotrophicum]